MTKFRKKTVDKVVYEHYWKGFFACLNGDERDSMDLEYGSMSGLYDYNPIARIAYTHGVNDCKDKLAARASRVKQHYWSPWSDGIPRIPADVYAEAYGYARLALPKAKR